MDKSRVKNTLKVFTILVILGFLLWSISPKPAIAQAIDVVSSSIVSEFPAGFRINVEARGGENIQSIAIRLKIGQQTRGAFDYLCPPDSQGAKTGFDCDGIKPSKLAKGELFWRTNTSARYIPPGTIIRYHFEVEDMHGNRFDTEENQFIYHDARFEWLEISHPPVTVAYHSTLVKKRAELVLNSIIDTLDVMGPVLGAGTEETIRVTMYNNAKEMLAALPPRSKAISRELITEGQAFPEIGTLLVLGGGRMAAGTASHEVTHILVHRAGDSIFRQVPPWLNEGLSEYGNIDPGPAYDIALDFAIETNRLLPIMYMNSRPGNPEQVIIFYGQGRSIVQYLIKHFGTAKMRELMKALKEGTNINEAFQRVYGHSTLELDNMWRDSVGAPRYFPPKGGRSAPTPIPQKVILPYSLTPQPGGEFIGTKSSKPTQTPTSHKSTSTLISASDVSTREAVNSAEPSCLASNNNSEGPQDLTATLWILGVIGLTFRRRPKS